MNDIFVFFEEMKKKQKQHSYCKFYFYDLDKNLKFFELLKTDIIEKQLLTNLFITNLFLKYKANYIGKNYIKNSIVNSKK